MAETPLFIGTRRIVPTTFIPGFGTRPRIIWTPGSSGSEIDQIIMSSSDNAARKVKIGVAKKLTAAANMGSGALVDGGGSSDTATRSSGSFVTDGWRAGERMLVQDATTLANDFDAVLTAVAALTLTFATGTVNTAEAFATATALYRLAWLSYVDVPAGAGLPSVVSVSGLDTTQMPSLDASPDRKFALGSDTYLVAALDGALDTGEILDITVHGGDY